MKQATYGDGTLYQRKDGRWEYKVKVGTKANGGPEYKSFYSRDKSGRKAKAAYKAWLEENMAAYYPLGLIKETNGEVTGK